MAYCSSVVVGRGGNVVIVVQLAKFDVVIEEPVR
jgi:hypothetical protein